MADKRIDDLTQALAINDDDLFVLQQSSEAKKLKGSQLKQYAKDAVNVEVQQAATYAKNAADSATDSATGATAAAQNAENAAAAKNTAVVAATNAEAAKNAIANMIVEAVTLETGQPANVTKTLIDQVYKLTFGLPRGEQGIQGKQGIQGEQGIQGIQGIQGKQGIRGEQGETGTGIQSIALTEGNHAPGTSDTYTITLTDGSTFNFLVYNGANGAGAGDMMASVYDPQNKHQDIFAYVDNAIKDVKVTTDATPTQGSTNPVQSGGVYSALGNKLDKTGDGSNVTATFTAAETRTNIATGEKLSVLLGKIAKWLSDLKALAFKDKVAKTDLADDVQTSLGKADSALQTAPVTSVNGQTGAVEIETGGDVVWVTRDNTYTELVEAFNSGKLVMYREDDSVYTATYYADYLGVYFVSLEKFTTSWGNGNAPMGVTVHVYRVYQQSDGTPYWQSNNQNVATASMAKPSTQKVTLTTAGWNSSTKQQSVTVNGVLADTTAQEISPIPVDTSYNSAWKACGIECVSQAANSLTFQCATVPTADIEVYVVIQYLTYSS